VRNIRKVVAALHEVGIYAIARVVCFKDNQLPLVRPEAAIRDGRHGGLWRDHTGMTWLDPHSEVAHAHVVAVARAAEEVGFDEVQLDYVRFPVDRRARYAQFPSRRGDPERHQVIAALLARVDRAIDVPLSADVFGLTAYRDGDPEGLGQSLEHLAPYLDAISPMVYLANWPRRYWESPRPAKTHALIHNAVRRVRRRLGDDIAVRPLLQAFKWRAENWGWGFVLNQVDAAETAGASGHLFWNQSGNYHMVASVWRHIDRKGRTFARR